MIFNDLKVDDLSKVHQMGTTPIPTLRCREQILFYTALNFFNIAAGYVCKIRPQTSSGQALSKTKFPRPRSNRRFDVVNHEIPNKLLAFNKKLLR